MATTFKSVSSAHARINLDRLQKAIAVELTEKPKAPLAASVKIQKAYEAVGKTIAGFTEKAEAYASEENATAAPAKGRGRPKKEAVEEKPAKKGKKAKAEVVEEKPAKKGKKAKEAVEEKPAKKAKKVKAEVVEEKPAKKAKKKSKK